MVRGRYDRSVDSSGLPDGIASFVTEHQRAGLVIHDSTGRIVGHNPSALTVLGLDADELLGRRPLDPRWQSVDEHLQPIDETSNPATRVLATGEPVLGELMGVRTGTGALRWLSIDAWPTMIDESGGAVVQFTDVTEALAARTQLHEALERLQRHALPNREIDVPGIAMHIRYRNVAEELDLGGDFIDVIPVNDTRFKFFIGDAAGHDLDTVATTIVAHHTLRAAALHVKDPGRVLTWLHNTLLATPDTVFCSAIQGRVSMVDGCTMQFANAGHPAPILVRGGNVRVLDEHGMIIGALENFPEPPTVTVELEAGDQVIFYTDGLIESQQPRMTPEHLAARCQAAAGAGAPIIDLIDELIAQAVTDEDLDDIAVLAFVVER